MGSLIDLWPLNYTDSVVATGALLLGVAAGVLGTFAVLRGRSLVGDALAHAALPGVCVAFLVTGAKDPATLVAGAACAGIVGAFAMVGIERSTRIKPDTAIGVVLSVFFSLGIVLLTAIAAGDNANQAGLERYLFGQAAGLVEADVNLMAFLAAGSLGLVVAGFRPLKTTLFDPAYAGATGLPVRALELAMTGFLVVAVVIGLRTVGAILMVAMLVTPAVAARQFVARLALLLPLAGAVGAFVGVTGALLSSRAEVPTGPVIVLVGFTVVGLSILLAPGRGVAWRAGLLRRERRRALVDGVLLDLEIASHGGPPPTQAELALGSGRPERALRRGVRVLHARGWVKDEGGRLVLTAPGADAAHDLVARRDEWSAWLEHGWRLRLPDAREPDPRDVRGSLGSEAADRLAAFRAEAAA
ncbi:MAG: Mn-Zn_transporter_SitC [uncultured Solirubrobacteraceae bacterium]|uniref:Mn-Zn_transporter_SitC n=1 Tax=uncultured Solirubrobacteraceae bacterium TaxID=1162706 RepID=A0A6J4RWV7_9ACTN|nr:MAG: Mn-Zn_transporter_SitC [uncultured Solirubrobacteraceae bacterium]